MSSRTMGMSDDLYAYLLDVSLREPPVMQRLRETTAATMSNAGMQMSPEQGQFLRLLLNMLGARQTIEVGVFTGYSALNAALALPDDGRVVACDINDEWVSVGQPFWREAGVADRIDLRLAPATETLDQLLQEGQQGRFDFAFIDADKVNYGAYYDQCLQLLRPGGVIAIDNVLWGGSVIDDSKQDENTVAIRTLNKRLHGDDRIDLSLIPIGDGLTLARKL